MPPPLLRVVGKSRRADQREWKLLRSLSQIGIRSPILRARDLTGESLRITRYVLCAVPCVLEFCVSMTRMWLWKWILGPGGQPLVGFSLLKPPGQTVVPSRICNLSPPLLLSQLPPSCSPGDPGPHHPVGAVRIWLFVEGPVKGTF